MSKRSLIALLTALLVVNQIKATHLKNISQHFAAGITGLLIQEQFRNSTKWPNEYAESFKKEMLKYADHKLDQAFLDKIIFTYKLNGQSAYAEAALSKAPIINIPIHELNKSKSILRYTLLHELGHIYHKDGINGSILYAASTAITVYSACNAGNMLEALSTAIRTVKKNEPALQHIMSIFCRILTKKIAVGASLGLSNMLLYRLYQRYCENRADDFAIECLSRQGDAQGLRDVANYYRPTDRYRSRTLTRLGIEPTRFYDIKAKAPLASKFIQLIDDQHLPIEEMCMKFDLAALKVDAQNKIKE